MMKKGVRNIKSVGALDLVAEVCEKDYPDLSSAASMRAGHNLNGNDDKAGHCGLDSKHRGLAMMSTRTLQISNLFNCPPN
jgi:hypothetical protein